MELPAFHLWEARPGGPYKIKRRDTAALAQFLKDSEAWVHRLTERELGVLRLRAEGRSVREIGQAYGVTGARIRQIEHKAIRKLAFHTRCAEAAR